MFLQFSLGTKSFQKFLFNRKYHTGEGCEKNKEKLNNMNV